MKVVGMGGEDGGGVKRREEGGGMACIPAESS